MTDRLTGAVPILCLVSDRRRAAAQGSWSETVRAFSTLAAKAGEAEISLFQVREPDLETAQLVDLVTASVEAARGSSMKVVVNDRLDAALATGAAGVHLRGDSIAPRAARSIAPPEFLIGRSVHHATEAGAHASAVDYLIAGTVFPSGSKPADHPLLGGGGLKTIVDAVHVPVLAIGGVTLDRVPEIAAAGAAGVAAIGLFASAQSLIEIAHAIRSAFDRVRTAS